LSGLDRRRKETMALQPKVEPKNERITLSVPLEIHELVKEYAQFLGKDTDVSYVYAQSALKVIRPDKKFRKYRDGRGAQAPAQGAARPGERVA
jgi:hypothetical protein